MISKIRTILGLDSNNDKVIQWNNLVDEESILKAEIDELGKEYQETNSLYQFQKNKLLDPNNKKAEDIVQSNIVLKSLDNQFKVFIDQHIDNINSLNKRKISIENDRNELLKDKAFDEYLKKVTSEKKKSTATIITNKDGEILLLRRHPSDQFYGGTWCLPGGGIDQNEDETTGATREVKEESGIDLTETSLVKTYDLPKIKLYYYRALVDNPEVILDANEHSNYFWAKYCDWKDMDLILDLKQHLLEIEKPELFINQNELVKAFVIVNRAFEKGMVSKEDFEKAKTNLTNELQKKSKDRGGKSDGKSLISIVEKFTEGGKDTYENILKEVWKQYQIGLKVELEHTDSKEKASDVVRDHLFEDYKYYTNSKPKDWAEKELEIEKSGEGSRGGHIIGHTRSGKPIYDNVNSLKHESFTRQDHLDASKVHENLGSHYNKIQADAHKERSEKDKKYKIHVGERETKIYHGDKEVTKMHFGSDVALSDLKQVHGVSHEQAKKHLKDYIEGKLDKDSKEYDTLKTRFHEINAAANFQIENHKKSNKEDRVESKEAHKNRNFDSNKDEDITKAEEREGKGELTKEQEQKIADYIKEHKNIDDEKGFHAFAEKLGVNVHEAEEVVYRLLNDELTKGETEVKEAMKHPNKLGEGAKKRKSLSKSDKFKTVMKEFANGTLHSGDGSIVTDQKQAVAIAYSEAKKIEKAEDNEFDFDKIINDELFQFLKEEVNYKYPSNTNNHCEDCKSITLLNDEEECLCKRVIGWIEKDGICDLFEK